MKTTKILIATLVCLPLLAKADSAADVQTAYENLDSAILSGNESAAFDSLSSESQDLIEDIRILALNANKSALSKEPIPIILSVFSIRKEAQNNPPSTAAETLMLMSADYAKTSEMADIGEVTVDGNTATGAMLMNGQDSGMNFSFVKEDGTWKVDMVQQLDDTEKMMMDSLQGTGMGREMIINQMASATQAQGFDPWKPLK